MSKFTCLVLCAVAVRLSCVYASGEGPASIDDVVDIILECSKENGVKIADIRGIMRSKDVTAVNPCLWSCVFKETGFLDDKGKYVSDPGLTYTRIILKDDKAYTKVENIAKQCESVKDKPVTDGEAGCEMGALVAACFIDKGYTEFQGRM